jgi:DNA-binding CsgD family transcriptional regulator
MEDKNTRLGRLTPRDKQVLNLLHQGVVKSQDIAASLGIPDQAVLQAMGRLRQVLGVQSRDALLQEAERLGFQFEEPTS